jgi:hypothetical protein
VPRHDDVRDALHDPNLSADRSGTPVKRFPAEIQAELSSFTRLFQLWLLFQDPPKHTRTRKLLNRSFTPRVLASWRPRVQEIVDDLLDNMQGEQEIDFMDAFARRLPAIVIAEMLGVQSDSHDDFIGWSADLANFFGPPNPSVEVAGTAQTALASMTDYFRAIIPQKRAHPENDVITILVRAKDEQGALTEEEVLAQCTLFLFAGHETTQNLLGNGVVALLSHPAQLDKLMSDPSLVRTGVDELLRFDSPIQFINRTVKESADLYGARLEPGDSVVLLLGSANRDPERFSDPDELDIQRDEGQHLAFGFGPHFCLGAPLTYLEGEVAFPTMFRRLPRIRVQDGGLAWDHAKPHFRNLASLRVTL